MRGPRLSSRAGFYLVTIGAAVGLGSIWRFPYLADDIAGQGTQFTEQLLVQLRPVR